MTAIAIAMLVAFAGQAAAQPPSQAGDGLPLQLDLSPPADTGKPHLYAPPLSPPSADCAVLDCRLRVIGTVQHNGAVELNATALKW